jgi:hypothetical protein
MPDIDVNFQEIKKQIEAEQRAPLEPAEEIECKALFYFSKGVRLKNELELEHKQRQTWQGVIQAVRDYFSGPQSKCKRTLNQRKLF